MFRLPEEQMAPRVLRLPELPTRLLHSVSGRCDSLGFVPGDRKLSSPCLPSRCIVLPFEDVPTELVGDFVQDSARPTRIASFSRSVLRPQDDRRHRSRTRSDGIRQPGPRCSARLRRSGTRKSPPGVDIANEAKISEASGCDCSTNLVAAVVSDANALPAVKRCRPSSSRLRLWAFAVKRQADWGSTRAGRSQAVECQPEKRRRAVRGRWHSRSTCAGSVRSHRPQIRRPASGRCSTTRPATNVSDSGEGASQEGGEERPRRWIDLQLPLYRMIAPHIADRERRAARSLQARRQEREKVRLGYISLPKKAEECEFMLADWNADELR